MSSSSAAAAMSPAKLVSSLLQASGSAPLDREALEASIGAVGQRMDEVKAELYGAVSRHLREYVATYGLAAQLNHDLDDVVRSIDALKLRVKVRGGGEGWREGVTADSNAAALSGVSGGLPSRVCAAQPLWLGVVWLRLCVRCGWEWAAGGSRSQSIGCQGAGRLGSLTTFPPPHPLSPVAT